MSKCVRTAINAQVFFYFWYGNSPFGEHVLCITLVLYLIKYVRNDLIKDMDLFHIPEAIFNSSAFKVDTSVIISVTFDISSIFFKFMDLQLYK